MMFNYLFSNMAIAHAIPADDPSRVARYDTIVQANLNWFFTTVCTTPIIRAIPRTTGLTRCLARRERAPKRVNGMWNGFYRLWVSGRYQFPTSKMLPFAITLVDVMTLGPNSYSGRVDGTSGSGHAVHTTTIHQGWLLLSDLRPDAYHSMMTANLPTRGSTGNLSSYNRSLFVKHRRSLGQ